MLGCLAGCATPRPLSPRTVSSQPIAPIVRVQPVGLWCDRTGTVVVEIENTSASTYFVGSSGAPERSAEWPFLWAYSLAYEADPSGELGSVSSGACGCADAACPACEVINTVVPLTRGERMLWTFTLGDLALRPGVATLELTLKWSGSYDRERVESAIDRAVVTSSLATQRIGETCWKVSAVPDHKPLQQPNATSGR